MRLELSSLQKAVTQLEEALKYADSDLARSDPHLALHLRAATIQAFEYTYELSHKMLRHHLENVDPNPGAISDLDFSGLIRAGLARGLLSEDLRAWRDFRQNRGATSHTYDEAKAQEVFAKIPRFLSEAKFLLTRIQAEQSRPS